MLNLNCQSFLFNFFSIDCPFEFQLEIKELFVGFVTGGLEKLNITVKRDQCSPWTFSTQTDRNSNYKIFNGFYTNNFEIKSKIDKFLIKCTIKESNLNKNNEKNVELFIDFGKLNEQDENRCDISIDFNNCKVGLECRILKILPLNLDGNLKINQINKFSLPVRDKPFFIGHRGIGRDTSPPILENTIRAFSKASEYGMDFAELDVHFTKDLEAIVYHDFFIKEGGNFKIINLTYEEVNQRTEPQKEFGVIPTLDRVMKEVPQKIGLLIELKYPQLNADGKMEHQSEFESLSSCPSYIHKNCFIDKILNIIFSNVISKPRNVVLLSFDADIAFMVKLKQDIFPVFSITRGCFFSEDWKNHADDRMNTLRGNQLWADFCHLDGVVSKYVESLLEEYLLCKSKNLHVFLYGDIPRTREFIAQSKNLGLDGLILDDVKDLFDKDLLRL